MKWYERRLRASFGRFHRSGGKKVVVDFVVHAVKELVSVGVPGVLETVQEGVHTGNGDGREIGKWLVHGCDFNASAKKAVSLDGLDGLRCLEFFILL